MASHILVHIIKKKEILGLYYFDSNQAIEHVNSRQYIIWILTSTNYEDTIIHFDSYVRLSGLRVRFEEIADTVDIWTHIKFTDYMTGFETLSLVIWQCVISDLFQIFLKNGDSVVRDLLHKCCFLQLSLSQFFFPWYYPLPWYGPLSEHIGFNKIGSLSKLNLMNKLSRL